MLIVTITSEFGYVAGAVLIDVKNPTMYDIEPAVKKYFDTNFSGYHKFEYSGATREVRLLTGGWAPYTSRFKIETHDAIIYKPEQ